MIGKGSQPTLSLVSKASIRTDYPLEKYIPPNLARRDKPKNKGQNSESAQCHFSSYMYVSLFPLSSTHTHTHTDVDVVSLWSVEEKLEIKVDSAANLNVGKDASVSRVQRSL